MESLTVGPFALLMGLWAPLATPGWVLDGTSHVPAAELTTAALPHAGPTPEPPPLDGLTVRVVMNDPVLRFLEFFQDARGRRIYARWLSKLGRYEALMGEILARHGVPRELLYVCMIESGFEPDAVSRAAAVGPWQFVKSTGRRYGLRHDAWVDERRDPIKSTEAAARHFADLYQRFGSWPLVMAAYNAGVGGVDRAIKRANTNDYWRLSAAATLPDQAIRYVPKAMAAMIIGQDPARYGFGDVQKLPPFRFETAPAPGGLALAELARKLDVPADELERLNPELRRGYTPPGGEYPLRVPVGRGEAARAALHEGSAGGGVFVEHAVRFGERLLDVARDYGTRRSVLRRVNELPAGEPRAGRVLFVPSPSRRPAREESGELLLAMDPDVPLTVKGRELVWFAVRRSRPLAEIADFFGVTVGDLALWNGLDPAAPAQRGLALRIFVKPEFDKGSAVLVRASDVVTVVPGTEAARNAEAFAKAERPPGFERVEHTIKRGDTLWRIAERYGTSVNAVRAENGLPPAPLLVPGQVVKVPRVRADKPRGRAKSGRAKPDTRGRRKYTIRRGDTLWKVAQRFEVTVKSIRSRNGLKRGAQLQPGMVLVIPEP